MGLIDKLLDKLIGGGHRQRFPKPVIAPAGYDPTQDPDGSIYARLVGQQMPGGGGGGGGIGVLGTLWDQVIRPLWWVWLAVAVMAAWGWWWWIGRPAKAEAQTAAAATVIAASWTATPTAAPTDTPTLEIPTRKPDGPRPAISTATPTTTPTLDLPTMTPARMPTRTLPAPPTETPPATLELPTPTPTSTATMPPAPAATATPTPFAALAESSAIAGDSMVVYGRVTNGSVVRILWENAQPLAQVTPNWDGTFAAQFVMPYAVKGYHVVWVVWSLGKNDQMMSLIVSVGVPTPTPSPIPTSTATAVPTPRPGPTATATPILPTPTPHPTPIGGWPFRFFFPLIFKGDLMTFISPLNGG